ncbi:MAG: copper amine oxidase N-terminal domain-containing protein [Candidatus Ornithomonoglobus sp.]
MAALYFKSRAVAFSAAIMIFTSYAAVYAEQDIQVIINDTPVEFEVSPQIIGERTMVPMRKIFETLGANVDWVPDAQIIIASSGIKIIAMEIGSCDISVTNVVSGETEVVELDVPPQIIDDYTLVPVRAVSESFDRTVTWDENAKTVAID